MAEVALWKVAGALGFGIVLAVVLAFVLGRVAEEHQGRRRFRALFLSLLVVYALGFAARYALVEVMP
ncbi:MAG: hypothetical protein AB7U59_04275 [Desulfovibrionaceae bacterium]